MQKRKCYNSKQGITGNRVDFYPVRGRKDKKWGNGLM